MTTDRDEALARVVALERALEDERAALAEVQQRAARLEQRIASHVSRWPRRPESDGAGTLLRALGGVASLIAVLVLCGAGIAAYLDTHGHAAPGPVCTLRTDPPGAHIYLSRSWGLQLLGTSPLTMTRHGWFKARNGGLGARKAGYRDTAVVSPWDGARCEERIYRLSPVGSASEDAQE